MLFSGMGGPYPCGRDQNAATSQITAIFILTLLLFFMDSVTGYRAFIIRAFGGDCKGKNGKKDSFPPRGREKIRLPLSLYKPPAVWYNIMNESV